MLGLERRQHIAPDMCVAGIDVERLPAARDLGVDGLELVPVKGHHPRIHEGHLGSGLPLEVVDGLDVFAFGEFDLLEGFLGQEA